MPIANSKQCGRRILFPCKNGDQLKLEANIMLTLNKTLKKIGIELKV